MRTEPIQIHHPRPVADPPALLSDNIDADTDIKNSGNVIDLISDNESSEDDEAGHFEHSAVAVPVEVVDTIDDFSDDMSTAPSGEFEVEPEPEAETDIEVQPLLPQHEAPIELEAESVQVDRATSLLRDLTAEDITVAQNAINGVGSIDEVLASSDTDSVQRKSLHTLQPGVWLNDEIIHYFLCKILAKRDAALAAKFHGRKRNHFFKSYMTTKLLDGPGGYNYRNVQRWSRKVPGKDIFALDKIFFPVNIGSQTRSRKHGGGFHWALAVIHMTKKRIQFYDSSRNLSDDKRYLEGLLQYLKDEHLDKKGCPLPKEDEWELVECTLDTPQQHNGFDCAVFLCMFCDFLSIDCPLTFSQEHINRCRDLIALSIVKGTAIE